MAGHFQKKTKTKEDIPTASLPDIIFMLLIFFMVSTVLRETTVQVRTALPSAEALTKIDQKRLVSYIYIGPRKLDGNRLGETGVQIDDALVEDLGNVRAIMYRKLLEQPRLIVSLKVDETSEMGMVLDVQQELREAGTLRINYSSKRELPS
ncbi:MAG: biopolymer transporter ExbD [Bacteroidetes bacterium]|nr:biopolymer transporter ExbD [Bacteroidota bacterium]